MIPWPKLSNRTFKNRMLKLANKINKNKVGHDPLACENTILRIKVWADVNLQLIKLADELPNPINPILMNDPGYLTAISILSGDRTFYLCEDCQFPMTLLSEKDMKEMGIDDLSCEICGDFFSEKYKIKI